MAIVRFGNFESEYKVQTQGTGFFVKYKKNTFLITCKHNIKNGSKGHYFFMSKSTNREIPNYIELYVPLKNVQFSKFDSPLESTDIAAFQVDSNLIAGLGITPIKLMESISDINYNAIACGYPNEYIKSRLNEQEYFLVPYEVKCIYSNKSELNGLNQKKVPYRVKNIRCATIEKCAFKNVEGISGGPIIDLESQNVLGMVAFSGLGGEVECGGKAKEILGIIPSSDIIEMIDDIVHE